MVRLELKDGNSSKFWECDTRGAELHVRFGTIGSPGTSQIKTLASPLEAHAAAQRLGYQKRQKGYVEAKAKAPRPRRNASPRVEPPPGKSPRATGPEASIVVAGPRGDVGAAWLLGKDVWFARVEGDDAGARILSSGGSLVDAIAAGGAVERWRFDTPVQARGAIVWVRAHAAETRTLSGDTRADPVAWSKRLGKDVSRVARFGVGARAALVATRDRTHPWIHARVPSTSYVSGRLMVPVWSLVGKLDARFAAPTGVYLSTCAQQSLSPYFDAVSEVVVQNAAPSQVDAYFTGHGGSFETVHLSQQVDSINATVRWAVTQHSGRKDTVGWYRTEHVKTLVEAKQRFGTLVTEHARANQRQKALGSWYGKILDEITVHNRVPGQRPATTKLSVQHAPMLQASSDDYASSRVVLAPKVVALGGAPTFCQEPWSFRPDNPWSKTPLLALASFSSGDAVLWSDVLNDGDGGTMNVWAAPGDPFGLLTFSCH